MQGFRNLAPATIAVSPRTTVLVGQNGQGKTNFLEACHLVCTQRALRAQKLSELVKFGEAVARVAGRFDTTGGERTIEVLLREGKRSAAVDGKPLKDPDSLYGTLAVVAFTPQDLSIVQGGPDARRRLLDRAVQNRFPAHLEDSRQYARALKARNLLLRNPAGPAVREAYDHQLARLGAQIRRRREALLAELSPVAKKTFAQVSQGETCLELLYQPAGRDSDQLAGEGDDLEARLQAALLRRLPRDTERGYTSVGPHADDLALSLNESPARLYASQGQGRAIVLALKIGEIENLRARHGSAPFLLLDDVSSELDPQRNAYLMQYLSSLDGQVILTTTDARLVADAVGSEARFYAVRTGALSAVSDTNLFKESGNL